MKVRAKVVPRRCLESSIPAAYAVGAEKEDASFSGTYRRIVVGERRPVTLSVILPFSGLPGEMIEWVSNP
jgi:hypothetical protein